MTASSWNLGGKLCALCGVLASLGFAGPVEARGTFTVLPSGVIPRSINDSGVIAGVEPGSGEGFLRTPDGTFTLFRAVDNEYTAPSSIYNAGVTTGLYFGQDHANHGFVRNTDGSITSFDAPGASETQNSGTYPASINAAGVITGYYTDQTGNKHGFVRAVDGTITAIDVPGADTTVATGVNDEGVVVGYWDHAITDHAFIRSADGTITSFDGPDDAVDTDALAINNKGVITGDYFQPDGLSVVIRGFVRRPNGTFATFGASDRETAGIAINDKGTVAGGDNIGRRNQAFVRYRNGKLKVITPPRPNNGALLSAINTDGVVVGYVQTKAAAYGFIWTP